MQVCKGKRYTYMLQRKASSLLCAMLMWPVTGAAIMMLAPYEVHVLYSRGVLLPGTAR